VAIVAQLAQDVKVSLVQIVLDPGGEQAETAVFVLEQGNVEMWRLAHVHALVPVPRVQAHSLVPDRGRVDLRGERQP
jgi:hypothetical protein